MPSIARPAAGKRRLRIAHAPLRRDTGKRGDDLRARRGNRGAGLGHDELETLEAGVIAHAVGEQAIALLHGALEVADARAVAGVEAEDEAVEETPALGGGAGEERVERRRHPDELDVLGEHAGTAGGCAVDAHDAGAALALRRGRGQPGADVDGARGRMHVRGDGPSPVPGGARQLRVGGAAQAVPGRQQRDGLEQVGLARTVGADQHLRLRPGLEHEMGVVAEVRKRQPLDPMRRVRAGVGGRVLGRVVRLQPPTPA